MKHIFILNPAAGRGIEFQKTKDKIHDACEAAKADYLIHVTECPDDATAFVKRTAAAKPAGETYRFYACGGDGTLNDVVCGVIDPSSGTPFPGIEVGCIPIGTGNDFVRNFTAPDFFLDITKQILGETITIDCFAINDRYVVNMVNVGFDCDVVTKTEELRKKKWIPKKMTYVAGLIVTLKKNLGRVITVIRSDGQEIKKEFELCAVANGGFCGGGFHSAPESKLDDGLLDISLIDKVSRTKFLSLVGNYKKGTHLNTKLGKKIVSYFQDHKITFRFAEPSTVCIDGEVETVKEAIFRVIPKALKFSLPVGVSYAGGVKTEFAKA